MGRLNEAMPQEQLTRETAEVLGFIMMHEEYRHHVNYPLDLLLEEYPKVPGRVMLEVYWTLKELQHVP